MRVAVITTSRADWNALQPVWRELQAQGADVRVIAIRDHAGMDVLDKEVEAFVVAGSGAHTLHGRDGFFIEELEEELESLDIVVLAGDRHETLAAAHAAVLAGVPIAHIAGGDVTTGSSDDKYRWAISMLADMHFPTNEASAARLQSTCGPNVYCYGSPAIDRLKRTPIMPRAETCAALGLQDARPYILANWQPETPKDGPGLYEMMKALAFQSLPGVFVGVNPDPGADKAEKLIDGFMVSKPQWRRHANLRPELYLSALFHAHCLIGNSSSGFYEAPYYGTRVINIGERQRGREQPRCMAWVPVVSTAEIAAALSDLDRPRQYDIQELYGDGTAAPKIAAAILTPLHSALDPTPFDPPKQPSLSGYEQRVRK